MSNSPHTLKKKPAKSAAYATKPPKKSKNPSKKRARKPKGPNLPDFKPSIPSARELKALKAEWYAKLKASGFEDLEVFDQSLEPAVSIPLKGRSATSYKAQGLQDRARFFTALRNFVTHNPKFSRCPVVQVVGDYYANGLLTTEILERINQGRRIRFKDPAFTKSGRMVDWRYGVELNLYSLHYIIKEFIRRAIKWNKTHPEGIWFEPDIGKVD